MEKVDFDNIDINSESVYLISYADGQEVFFRNQNTMARYALNKGVDFILNYRKKHLAEEFLADNKEILQAKRGAGMWLWKPYLLLETMKTAPENSFIIYLDSAFYIKKPLKELLNKLGDKDILLIQDRDRKNGEYVKGDSFALMNCLSEECRNGPHIWSAAIITRNTPTSRAFIKEWLDSAKDIRILSNEEYGIQPNYPEYKWHHCDQSVLSLVYQNNADPVKLIPFEETTEYLSWVHRKNSNSSPYKAWYSVYGANPLINFNKTGKALPSTALLNTPPIVILRKWLLSHF